MFLRLQHLSLTAKKDSLSHAIFSLERETRYYKLITMSDLLDK